MKKLFLFLFVLCMAPALFAQGDGGDTGGSESSGNTTTTTTTDESTGTTTTITESDASKTTTNEDGTDNIVFTEGATITVTIDRTGVCESSMSYQTSTGETVTITPDKVGSIGYLDSTFYFGVKIREVGAGDVDSGERKFAERIRNGELVLFELCPKAPNDGKPVRYAIKRKGEKTVRVLHRDSGKVKEKMYLRKLFENNPVLANMSDYPYKDLPALVRKYNMSQR